MFAIIGILVVFGAVVAGYLMEHGNLKVLIQPAELVIIGGAAIGTVLVANPLHILKKIARRMRGVFGGSKFNKKRYLETLKMMYDSAEQGTQRWIGGSRSGYRRSGKESDPLEISRFHRKIITCAILSATPCAWRSAAAWSPSISTR